MKIWSFIICLLILNNRCYSQTADKEAAGKWQIAAALIGSKMTVIDKEFSALPFSAIVPGAGLSIQYNASRILHQLSFTYLGAGSTLTTTTKPAYHLDQDYLNLDYTALYQLGTPDNAWTGGIGAALQGLYTTRTYPELINDNHTSKLTTSLGLAGRIAYTINEEWYLEENINVPLLTSFLRLKNAASLTRQLSTQGMLSLTYTWDYYKNKDQTEVRQAIHCLQLTYHLIL